VTVHVTVLAPAYNEEAVIENFVTTACGATPDDWELLVVDDGSTDRTAERLAALVLTQPRLRVITHRTNRGMGAALATGFEASTGDVIVTMDADLSHPLELAPTLVRCCETADAAFASRYVRGGGMVGVPLRRVIISRIANTGLRFLFAAGVRDLTTGFRAYRTSSVQGLGLRGRGFESQLEITIKLVAAGRRIVEIPLLLGVRAAGTSKMRYLPLIPRYGSLVLRLLALRWFSR
jgi:dolichol-phosphate mannosyltransferase